VSGVAAAELAALPAAASARLDLSWGLRGDVPVTPDADTARLWLKEELLDPVYVDQPSLLMRFIEWLTNLFTDPRVLAVNPVVASLVIVGVLLAVAGVAYLVAGPVRLSRRTRQASAVFEDDERSASDLRAAADAAAAAGDWGTAVVERYRAVVRSLEERVVLDPRPGRTAHEAADEAAPRLPALTGALTAGARLFDDVRYGKVVVGPEADRALRELDTAALASTPLATTPRPSDPSGGDHAGESRGPVPAAVPVVPTDAPPTATTPGGAR
jgi:hypothetical protein